MNRTHRTVVLAAAAVVIAPSASAINLLANPGFETGNISPWFNDREYGTNGSGQLWHAVNTDFHSGSWSALVESNKEMRQNFANPVAGTDITAGTIWIKNPEASIFGLYWYYSDNTEDFTVYVAPDGNWNQYNHLPSLNTSKTVVGFGVNGYIGGGTAPDLVFADDAVVEAVPEPASLAALGIGALALLRRRRRA